MYFFFSYKKKFFFCCFANVMFNLTTSSQSLLLREPQRLSGHSVSQTEPKSLFPPFYRFYTHYYSIFLVIVSPILCFHLYSSFGVIVFAKESQKQILWCYSFNICSVSCIPITNVSHS
jgi:hypothetical protein